MCVRRAVATGAVAVLLTSGVILFPAAAALAACGPVGIAGSNQYVVEGEAVTYQIDPGGCGASDFQFGLSGSVEDFGWQPAAGKTSFTLTATPDVLAEVEESVTVSLIRNGMNSPDASVTVTIGANAIEPTLTIQTVVEGGLCVRDGGEWPGDQPVRLQLNQASPRIVEFTYAIEAGTASSPGDFRGVVGGRGRIGSGDFATAIMVAVHQDGLVEPEESFTVRITSVTGATVRDDRCEYRIPANHT